MQRGEGDWGFIQSPADQSTAPGAIHGHPLVRSHAGKASLRGHRAARGRLTSASVPGSAISRRDYQPNSAGIDSLARYPVASYLCPAPTTLPDF